MKKFSILLTILTFFSFSISHCMDNNDESKLIPISIKIIFAGSVALGGYYLYQHIYNKPNDTINNSNKNTFTDPNLSTQQNNADASQFSNGNINVVLKTELSTIQNNNTNKIIGQPNVPQTENVQLSNENKNSSLNTKLSTQQNNNTDKIIDQAVASKKEKPKKSELFEYILHSIEEMHLEY